MCCSNITQFTIFWLFSSTRCIQGTKQYMFILFCCFFLHSVENVSREFRTWTSCIWHHIGPATPHKQFFTYCQKLNTATTQWMGVRRPVILFCIGNCLFSSTNVPYLLHSHYTRCAFRQLTSLQWWSGQSVWKLKD